MFKYTPPWQVLCATLESRAQGQESVVLHAEGLQVYKEPEINLAAEQQLSIQKDASEELKEESSPEMDRVTRNLIFQIPYTTPKCNTQQRSSSAELSNDDVFVPNHTNQNGHDWRPSSPQEDRSKLANPTDVGRDLWTPPPDRDSNLEFVKSGTLYNLRAYKEERKPNKLYEDAEEELSYSLSRVDISPEKAKELEEERKAVIQSQVVRRSSTTAEKRNSIDELDSLSRVSVDRSEAQPGGSYIASFALCFNSPPEAQMRTPVDPENIDREQINFAAARQQFLMLEKTKPNLLFGPRQQISPPKPESTQNVYEREGPGTEGVVKVFMDGDDDNTTSLRQLQKYDVVYKAPTVEELCAPKKASVESADPNGRMGSLTKTSSRDDLDSGLGEMSNESSAGYISDGSISNEVFVDAQPDSKVSNQDPAKELKARNETPIEREIRLAMEREESLRKERGIQRLTNSNEMVEIQTKPLFTTSFSSPPSRKAKDKGCVSFYVRREIEQETKREEDLKKEGRLQGMYDKGVLQELGERKRIFEQEEASLAPHKQAFAKKSEEQTRTLNGKLALEEAMDGMDCTTDGKRVPNHNANLISFQANQPYSTPNASKRSPVDQLLSSTQPSASCSKVGDEDPSGTRESSTAERADSTPRPEERFRVPKEYFSIPFWKPKISFVGNQGMQDPLGKEKVMEPRGAQEDQYILKKCKPQTSWLIEEEIRSVLQREQELQEQRRHRLLTDNFSPASDDSTAKEKGFQPQLSSQSSATSSITDRHSLTEPPTSVPAPHQSEMPGSASSPNVTSPYQGYMGRLDSESAPDGPTRVQRNEKKRKLKEDKKYASIEAIDDINAEVLESTRVTRHKNAMAERWESGLFFQKDEA
ncbi:mitotic interactor and substrate of PLK1 isoform X2 [Carettochelys insculpta]|uniref:mitotic interactor and substrate of PLK1 isoform X2 n=1 Tax=Carettochelys insculpta TaxID=44489 RepID=UPI003EB940FB